MSVAVDPLIIESRHPARGQALLHLVGEVDLLTAPKLRCAVSVELGQRPRTLVVDLSAVTFFCAVGIGALADAARKGADQGTEVLLVVTSRAVSRPLHITGVDRVIPVCGALTEALRPAPDPRPDLR